MDETERKKLALWRFSVLGPLISCRLEQGDRQQWFTEAAARVHQQPDGRLVELSPRTVESWYYAYRKGGFEALYPKPRSDRGHSRVLTPEVAERILCCKREKPRRSIRRIIRMLERAQVVHVGELSRSTVHRLLMAQGVSARPVRGPQAERRSFLLEHSADLCVGDAMHLRVPVIGPDGCLRKAYLLSQIDAATRYIMHSTFALSEGAVEQERGFKEVILKHGPPRAYYVDRGAAYIADSLQMICAELGIRLLHTGAGDAEAKGVIERWHRTFRDEVEDELPKEPLTLGDLQGKLWAWLSVEYHARKHETTQRAPREHFLAEVEHLRTLPRGKNLDEIFLHRESRKVRGDGTVRFRGAYLEVRPELMRKTVELRYDPSEEPPRPKVFVKDRFFCDTVPLDRYKNATRKRRRTLGEPEPDAPSSGLSPLSLIEAEHYQRVRPLAPRTPSPLDEDEHNDTDPDSED